MDDQPSRNSPRPNSRTTAKLTRSASNASLFSRNPAQEAPPQIVFPSWPSQNVSFRRGTLAAEKIVADTTTKSTKSIYKVGSQITLALAGSREHSRASTILAASECIKPLSVGFSKSEEEVQKKNDKTKDQPEREADQKGVTNGYDHDAVAGTADWNKEGGELLSREYLKGINQRLFLGGSNNINEHKRLIKEIQVLKGQRRHAIRQKEQLIAHQRQMIMKGKEDFQNKIAAAQNSKKGKKKKPKAALPPMSLPKLFHPEYTHRKTQVAINEIAQMANGANKAAKSHSRLGQVISDGVKDIQSRLFNLGLVGEKEGTAAELLLEIRDAMEVLSLRTSKSSLLTNGTTGTMDQEIQAIIMANRRKEIVETIVENTRLALESLKAGKSSFLKENMKGQGVANAAPGNEEDQMQIMNTLALHSKLLQSHPLVQQAILLGGNIPPNLGGLGGRDFGREEKEKPKKKLSEDSTSDSLLLQQEETKKGYCTVLGMLRALNLIETKCVRDRISKWCRQMATEKMASDRVRTKFKKAENMITLRTI